MRLAYFSTQMPFPPNHGGRVDDWRRLCALKAAGARIHLVTWCSDRPGERPEPSHLEALRGVAEVVHVWPIRRTLAERLVRLSRLPFWPSHVASRMPSAEQWAALESSLSVFRPEVVWQDGLYPYVVAQRTAQRWGVKRFYRSHNIEHLYFARQVARATSLRDRWAWGLNLHRLEEVERRALGEADAYFDISTDDLAYWQQQGYGRGHWLPPLVAPEFASRLSAPRVQPPGFDVGYLGNLNAPNNVEGVLWFVEQVVPRLLKERPQLRVRVAGSQPLEKVRAAVAQVPEVTLLENAPDAVEVLRDARVLVNPVFAGSGVNVKSVEMLFSPARLVSAPQGVAGLPGHVQACFAVADEPDAFAAAVLRALDEDAASPGELGPERRRARGEFDFARMHDVLAVLADLAARKVA